MFLTFLFGFCAGAASIILLVVLAIWYWMGLGPKDHPSISPVFVKVKHPKKLTDYCKSKGAAPSESCMFLNLMIAFLWREWRDSTSTKSYFIKKMNLEFQELLLYKTAGKLLQKIHVKDYCLGDSLPIIKKATVMKVQARSPDEVAEELDLALEIEYSGGFLMSLDVDFIFGRTGYLAVKLKSLKGRLRLQFTRFPCTHWSFSFYEDPEIELQVESQFNGRNLAKLTTLIKNQIIKSVKRKHTLPRYKVRYKPFFKQPIIRDGKQDVYIHNNLITVGKLSVEIMGCSRLPIYAPNSQLYCISSIDSLPWKEDMPAKSSRWPAHEVVLGRTLSGSIGVTIRQSSPTQYQFDKEIVVIDTISPQSPASMVDIRRGDIVLSINDIDIDSLKQAIRLMKNGGDKLIVKLLRPTSVPSLNGQERDVFDMEIDKEEEISCQPPVADGQQLQNSCNIMCDEDSDGDDFVNIVVKELEEQIGENDDAARRLLRKVSESSKRGTPEGRDSHDTQLDNDGSAEGTYQSMEITLPKTARCSGIESTQSKSSASREEKSLCHGQENIADLRGQNPALGQPVGVEQMEMTEEIPFKDVAGKHNSGCKDERMHSNQHKLCKSNSSQRDSSGDSGSESSETQSMASVDGDADWDNISQQTLFCKEELGSRHKTSSISCSMDPVWNESFTFDVEKQHKFLNVCVWSKSDERYNKDILIGYSSISLMDLSLECLSTTSGKHTQQYILTPPYTRAGVSRIDSRLLMPGLKPEACNGDITLSIYYKPTLSERPLSDEKIISDPSCSIYGSQNEKKKARGLIADEELDMYQVHEFMPTQVYFRTRCDYCQKKIWTKTAFQCHICAMVLHKRCINNAHSNTYCTKYGVRAKPPLWHSGDDSSMGPNGPITKENAAFRDGAQLEATAESTIEQLNCLASDYLELGKSKPPCHKQTIDKPQMTNAERNFAERSNENAERSNENSNVKDPFQNEN